LAPVLQTRFGTPFSAGKGSSHTFLVFCGFAITTLCFASISVADVLESVDCIEAQPAYTSGKIACTLNDIVLANPNVIEIDSCDYPDDTLTLDISFDLTTQAPIRYDVAVWFSVFDLEGDGPASGGPGDCTVASLSNSLLLRTDAPPTVPGNYDTDYDGDWCGDISTAGQNGDTEVSILQPQLVDVHTGPLTLLCLDTDEDGYLDVPVIVSWALSSSAVCSAANDAVPDAYNRCNFNSKLRLEVPIPGRITVSEDTVPGDFTAFQFHLTGAASGIEGGFDGMHDFELAESDALFDSAMFTGGLPAGVYSVAEDANPAYTTVVTCDSNLNGAVANPAGIDLAPGETVNCLFTNTIASPAGNLVFENNFE